MIVSSHAKIDVSIGVQSVCVAAYPLWEDAVRRQQRPFCEDLEAGKRLERNRRQTTSTAVFVLVYPDESRREKKKEYV